MKYSFYFLSLSVWAALLQAKPLTQSDTLPVIDERPFFHQNTAHDLAHRKRREVAGTEEPKTEELISEEVIIPTESPLAEEENVYIGGPNYPLPDNLCLHYTEESFKTLTHLHPVRITNSSESEGSTEDGKEGADIAFVLRGYANSRLFDSTDSFDTQAKEVMSHLAKLSFGKVRSYTIWEGGLDKRDAEALTAEKQIDVIQAALAGWPGWPATPPFGGTYPIPNATQAANLTKSLTWMKANSKTYFSWYDSVFDQYWNQFLSDEITWDEFNTLANALAEEEIFSRKILGFQSSASLDFIEGMRLPESFNARDYQATIIIFHNNKGDNNITGAANTLAALGVKNSDGSTAPGSGAYSSYTDKSKKVGDRITVHEIIHALGMGTHDNIRGPDLYRKYSVMKQGGSIDTLPFHNRFFWLKWIKKEDAVTKNFWQVCDGYRALNPKAPYLYDAGENQYIELYNNECIKYKNDGRGSLNYAAMTDADKLTCNYMKGVGAPPIRRGYH